MALFAFLVYLATSVHAFGMTGYDVAISMLGKQIDTVKEAIPILYEENEPRRDDSDLIQTGLINHNAVASEVWSFSRHLNREDRRLNKVVYQLTRMACNRSNSGAFIASLRNKFGREYAATDENLQGSLVRVYQWKAKNKVNVSAAVSPVCVVNIFRD